VAAVQQTWVKRFDMYSGTSNYGRSQEITAHQPNFKQTKKRSEGISVIILNLNKPELIVPLLESLVEAKAALTQRGLAIEIIVGDTGSTDEQVLALYDALKDDILVKRNMHYHFSRCNNELFDQLSTKHVALFMNNDIIFEDATAAIHCLYKQIVDNADVGIAGSYLFYPDMSVQHMGVNFFREGEARGFCYHPGHRQRMALPEDGFAAEVPAVTGAMLMIRSDLFFSVDGFDSLYEEECQDVSLCLSVKRMGYRIIGAYTGKTLHLENATRPNGSENWNDRNRFLRKWYLFVSETVL
jgi:GT2 family glycosyltransferase